MQAMEQQYQVTRTVVEPRQQSFQVAKRIVETVTRTVNVPRTVMEPEEQKYQVTRVVMEEVEQIVQVPTRVMKTMTRTIQVPRTIVETKVVEPREVILTRIVSIPRTEVVTRTVYDKKTIQDTTYVFDNIYRTNAVNSYHCSVLRNGCESNRYCKTIKMSGCESNRFDIPPQMTTTGLETSNLIQESGEVVITDAIPGVLVTNSQWPVGPGYPPKPIDA